MHLVGSYESYCISPDRTQPGPRRQEAGSGDREPIHHTGPVLGVGFLFRLRVVFNNSAVFLPGALDSLSHSSKWYIVYKALTISDNLD